MDDGNKEFPTVCAKFVKTLVGTKDEVWTHWLMKNHGRESHTVAEWKAILAAHKNAPAYPKKR